MCLFFSVIKLFVFVVLVEKNNLSCGILFGKVKRIFLNVWFGLLEFIFLILYEVICILLFLSLFISFKVLL